MNGPVLWYANRGTGLVLLVLYTGVVVLGVISTWRRPSPRGWPRFATQSLHRYLGLLAGALLAAHVATAVVDDYVDIRWWQAFVPFGATYRPLFLELGTVALDLTVAVVAAALLRQRLSDRLWRGVHLLAYPTWAVAVVHSLGIGTDAGAQWVRLGVIGCAVVVTGAAASRVLAVGSRASAR